MGSVGRYRGIERSCDACSDRERERRRVRRAPAQADLTGELRHQLPVGAIVDQYTGPVIDERRVEQRSIGTADDGPTVGHRPACANADLWSDAVHVALVVAGEGWDVVGGELVVVDTAQTGIHPPPAVAVAQLEIEMLVVGVD